MLIECVVSFRTPIVDHEKAALEPRAGKHVLPTAGERREVPVSADRGGNPADRVAVRIHGDEDGLGRAARRAEAGVANKDLSLARRDTCRDEVGGARFEHHEAPVRADGMESIGACVVCRDPVRSERKEAGGRRAAADRATWGVAGVAEIDVLHTVGVGGHERRIRSEHDEAPVIAHGRNKTVGGSWISRAVHRNERRARYAVRHAETHRAVAGIPQVDLEHAAGHSGHEFARCFEGHEPSIHTHRSEDTNVRARQFAAIIYGDDDVAQCDVTGDEQNTPTILMQKFLEECGRYPSYQVAGEGAGNDKAPSRAHRGDVGAHVWLAAGRTSQREKRPRHAAGGGARARIVNIGLGMCGIRRVLIRRERNERHEPSVGADWRGPLADAIRFRTGAADRWGQQRRCRAAGQAKAAIMEKDILLRSAGVDQIGGEGIESEEAAGGAQRGLPAHAVSQIASIVRRNDLDNAGRGRGMHDPAGIAPNKECAEGEDGQATPARVPHQLPPQPMPKWVRAAAGPEGTQKGYVAFRL